KKCTAGQNSVSLVEYTVVAGNVARGGWPHGEHAAARRGERERSAVSGKVWFITGASRGFGRIWARAALERGDRVAASARVVAHLDGLVEQYGDAVLPLRLDVSDREAVHSAVAAAHRRFGRLDVVVNNAGYGLFGPVENATEQQARDQMDTNFFGTLWVTQAVLPLLRAQRGGHIVQVS